MTTLKRKSASTRKPPKAPKYPNARWFNTLGTCAYPGCGKPAIGNLMSERNDRIGPFCRKHGEQHAKEALAALSHTPPGRVTKG